MSELFVGERFTGFGSCALDPPGVERPVQVFRGRERRLRTLVRQHAPRHPGVYGMIDANGDLIYVGKAKSLRSRLMGYFLPDSRDPKAGKILDETSRLVWELAPCEFSALLRELELIRRFQPRFNVQGMPRRMRRCYICIGRRPAPHAFVALKPPARGVQCFGPVAGLGKARDAVRRLNDWYRLRDCPQKQIMRFADQAELFPVLHTPGCLRHDIGHCLAPCAAACSQHDYAFHVAGAIDFLSGKDTTPLDQLDRQMNEAAQALEFERAVVLRDRLEALTWLARQLERLRLALQHSCIYPVECADGSTLRYLIRHGVVRAVLPAPTDEVSQTSTRERLRAVFGGNTSGMPGLDEIDGVLLVDSWFRRNREERKRQRPVEKTLWEKTGVTHLPASPG